MTLIASIQRRPVLAYYAVVFAISWGGLLLLVAPSGFPATPDEASVESPLFSIAFLATVAGPVVAGLLLTGLVHGRAGLRAFRSRLSTWRVGAHWYAVALLTAPAVVLATLAAFLPASSEFVPALSTTKDRGALLLTGLLAGLAAGVFEELGWTGFAVPELRQRHSILSTGLIAGFLWGAWHFLVFLWASGDASRSVSWDALVPNYLFFVGVLPAYRVLLVWLYDRTGSLPLAMLMHAPLSATTSVILAPQARGALLFTYYLAMAAAFWAVVAVVARSSGGHLRQPPAPAINV